MSIDRIKSDIEDELSWDTRVNSGDIEVKVDSNGTVELTGSVPTFTAKRAAEEDIQALKEIKTVKNELKVLYPAAQRPPKDKEVAKRVRSSLSATTDVNEADLEVSVNSGYVTLSGHVDAYWKKIKAENVAAEVTGVIDIVNEIEVIPAKDRGDKTIEDDIIATLHRSAFVDPDNVNVEVKEGTVSLSGTVKNWKAHDAVIRASTFTAGVTEVNDDLVMRMP